MQQSQCLLFAGPSALAGSLRVNLDSRLHQVDSSSLPLFRRAASASGSASSGASAPWGVPPGTRPRKIVPGQRLGSTARRAGVEPVPVQASWVADKDRKSGKVAGAKIQRSPSSSASRAGRPRRFRFCMRRHHGSVFSKVLDLGGGEERRSMRHAFTSGVTHVYSPTRRHRPIELDVQKDLLLDTYLSVIHIRYAG